MERSRAEALLTRTELFAHAAPAAVSHVAASLVESHHRRGDVVFHEGDDGDTLYVVADGRVKVTVASPQGDELVLALLRPPDTFGELAALEGGPRSASARVVDDATLLGLSRGALQRCMADSAAVAVGLLHSLGALVRRLTDQASDLVFLDLHGRIAKLLLTMTEESSGIDPDVLDLQLTQSELAAMVGGSRQSVNQILRGFEQLGYVAIEGRRIVIRRHDLLSRRAGLSAVAHPTGGMSRI